MDENGIIAVCEALGLSYGRPYPGTGTWGPHISIACPLAIVKHSDPFDANMGCSVMIVPDGPSGARCFSPSCGFRGSFTRLIRTAATMRPPSDSLSEVVLHVCVLEKLTPMARHARATKKLSAIQIQKGPDRDVLPESAFADFANKVPRYAIKRGLTIESCKRWGLGYDKDLGYLVFPVRRPDGKLVGLVGRSVRENPKRRHHNYAGLDKSRHLFGAQLIEVGKPIVIVEGCIDAIKVDQALAGDACVMACLGEGFSQQHERLIAGARPSGVYVFTDGDVNGRLMGGKIAHCLHGRIKSVKLMECPWGPQDETGKHAKVDPDTLPAEYIRHLFKNAKPVLGQLPKWTDPVPIFDAKTYAGTAA